MPMFEDFKKDLFPIVKDIADHFGTPFHIYDEKGIYNTGENLKKEFSDIKGGFTEYFAVKALPNTTILEIMKNMGFGFDCSSIPELAMSRMIGARGSDIMFTSNNTKKEEFEAAMADGGSIINLDDITFLQKLPKIPELICFRYNPGHRRTGNSIIGNPVEAKYGVSHDQIIDAYREAIKLGIKQFGLHTMLVSNEIQYEYMIETAKMLIDLAEDISKNLGIKFEFINIGGGLGIPYRPEQNRLDLKAMAKGIKSIFNEFNDRNGYCPKLFIESGRYMTGPHGVLVTKAINRKSIYRNYVGVDACMSSLMRPAIYGAYHHISVLGKDENADQEIVDIVGALCENNDKFAVQRKVPVIKEEDLIIIHDTGAHGYAMGFNYNGRLRPKELLLKSDGSVELIRREETLEDYLATLNFKPKTLKLN
ncbi:MAG: diaminopimelate decarboxylase [Desulfobacterales bacterium]|nr:diaminopimelate decarboxylase [Desulfobacterales bacterium]